MSECLEFERVCVCFLCSFLIAVIWCISLKHTFVHIKLKDICQSSNNGILTTAV